MGAFNAALEQPELISRRLPSLIRRNRAATQLPSSPAKATAAHQSASLECPAAAGITTGADCRVMQQHCSPSTCCLQVLLHRT